MILARRFAACAAFVALAIIETPALAQRTPPPAQRGGQPGPETPHIQVTAFRAPTKELAVGAADELRSRLQSEHSAKELFVITKPTVEATLRQSGYPVDSALTGSDVVELGRSLRAEYMVDGSATKPGAGTAVRFELHVLIRTGQQTLTQPLPVTDGKDLGDAAKQAERAISEALTQMPSYTACISELRAGRYDQAAAKARVGIAAYPNGLFTRLCLLNALTSGHAPADSIIAVSNQILAIDSTSTLALANLADAYDAKGDSAKATDVYERLYQLDPSNGSVGRVLWGRLAQRNPERAAALINAALKDSPGDVGLIRFKWLVQLNAKLYKAAYATADEYIKLAPDSATRDFYTRMVRAAQADSNAAKVQEFAGKASQKYPKELSFLNILAQSYIKSGQMQQALAPARRATELDPKNQNAWLLAIAAANGANMRDSSSAFARMAIAAGADKKAFATALLGATQDLVAKAQASNARADWEAVLRSAESVDSMASSPESNFFIGVSSYTVAADMVHQLQDEATKAQKSNKAPDKAAACGTAKQIEDLLVTTSIAMPRGASVSQETAGKIMSGIDPINQFAAQIKRVFTCK